MKFRKVVRKRALVVILMITMICQGIVPAYADTPDKHSESENVASGVISEEDSPVADEIVLASPDNAAYDSGKNEDVSIEEVFEEDPLSADGLILGTPINEEDDRLIIGSEGTVLRVPDNPKDIELVYSLEDDTYIGSTYSTEIDNEYSDKFIFVQLTLTPLDPQQIAFGSREQKVKIPLSDMLIYDDRIYFSIEASNEMKLTNSEVKDNWEVELSLLISDDENTELEDLTDGEMFHREGYAQSGDDAFAFADSVLFTVENIKQTSFDPYSLLVVMAPQDTWWKSENYQRSDIDEIIFGQTPAADIKETWNADADNYGFIKCFITETIGDNRSYRTLYIARTEGNSSRIMANPDSRYMFSDEDHGVEFWRLTRIDIGNLDTSNVSNMENMFYLCYSLKELDLSGFDTGKVTDMSSMFGACYSLEELDISSFDTGKVTDMSSMFEACHSLEELDISSFDTGNVTNMSCMFNVCNSLEELDLSGFDTSSVTYMGHLISGCSSLKELDLSGFDTGKVTDMSYMFEGCDSLEELDISSFDTGNVTYMGNLISGCSSLKELDLSGFDTGKVTDMSYMFEGCDSLEELDISSFDTGNVTNMSCMFSGCAGLLSLNLNSLDTGSVTDMSYMFRGCNSLEELDLSGFDTSSVTYMGNLISGCSNLKEIDLSSFNTGNTIIMEGMFEGCEKLTELDLSRFKTDNVTRMFDMFKGCERLTTIFAYEFDTDNVPSIYNYDSEMFAGCISLTGEKGTKYDANHVGKEYAHIDGGADAPGYFTSKESEQEESVKYTVTFDSNGHGTAPAQQQIAEGEKIEKPDDLVSEGYTFEGWYKESSCENRWDFDTEIVSKDITLFAKWTNSTEIASGISGTCRWSVDGDTLIIQALDKQDGTLDLWTDTPPWYDYRTEISDVRLLGNIHAKTCRRMFAEFNSAYIRSNTILDLSNLDTSEVTDMSGMFYACNCKGLNLEGIDTSNVINMSAMFYDFKEELDLSSFDTRNVTDMSGMFMGGYKDPGFSATVSLNLSSFNTEKVTDMHLMFYDTYFDLSGLNLGNFDTENVIDMGGMFCDCDSLTTLNLNNFDTSNVKTMGSMFSGCSSLTTLDVSSFDTKKVTDMNYMFSGCSSLAELNLKNFDTSSVGSMSGMFCGCSALTIIDLSSFDADSVYDTEWMFANCTNLKNVDLSNFAENKIKSTRCMFKDCSSLTNVNFGSFETSNIENMTEMFSGCSSLTELDISSFSYRALIDKSNMFYGCADLKTIIVDKFCHDSGYSSSMFGGCTKLVGGKGTTYDENHINGEYAHIDGGESNPGYFTSVHSSQGEIPESNLKITRFISPSGNYVVRTKLDLKCYAFEVETDMSDIAIDIEVTEGAEWKLYSDAACKNELNKNDKVSLSDETNYFYVKVYNDSESAVYAIELNKDLNNKIKSASVSYKSFFAEDKDKDIKIDIQWGWDLFKNPLDHNVDRRTMIAALMLANGAYNNIEQVYEELGFNHICPNRRDREMDMAQYSFAGREVDFDGNKKLIISLTFRGTQNVIFDGLWDAEAALGADFKTGAASAVADMQDYFEHNLNQYDKEDMIFFVTGHSLGGAEANEAAMLLAKEYNPENIFAYTFSSPTTTDKSDYSVPKLFNLYNTEDIVPKAGENFGIIQNITNGQWLGKRYGHDMPFTRGAFMEDEFRLITGGRGFNDVAPLYQSDYSTSFFESMGIALSNIFNSVAYNIDKIMLEHQPDTLLAYLLSSESVTVKPSQPGMWRKISVKCPVDIEVIDSDGISVAKIVDNQIKELKDLSLTLFVCGDEKYILSSDNKDYYLKLIGTDNGEMILSVDEIDFSTGEETTEKQFNHVVLYDGKEMLGTVNEEAEQSALQLMENGKPIKNIETNGTETPISTTYTVSFNANGHGIAPASQQISAGEKVSKPADATASGYTFGGWYKESSCVNKWNFDTDVVNGNMTLYAKWTSKDSGYSGNYSSGSSGGSGGGGGSVSKPKTTTGATYSPNWFVDAAGVWKIKNSKGEIVKNAWLCDDVITANGKNVWYLLQADGSMLSAGLVQDNTGNFYSLETNHNGYFGMMRYKDGYYDCNGQQVYLKFNQKHDNSFGAVINEDGLEKLKQIYGITKYPIGNETCTYTASF